ncbi:GntR family transcriptional regulator [Aquibacillus albus]|uniref:GntR family transcriptional regulator of arabinose operon n=1 Tax=Aquibacillus albus TaxID=1168171 RepID=A0ABS2MXR6_9BACI|nr:GntR family transcriptional regulator [Aquibacillus albus]MBM7570688.1 GntR family transcriptional regulator of arabinose operon [Aquibacillus albus]
MTSKYQVIKQAIKSKILEGTLAPHQKLSSENDMIKEYGVSRHTVRLAIGELANEGWLYKVQGSGTYCADRSKTKSLRQPNNNIAIITTYISEYIFPSIIRGAESYLSKHGYNVTIFNTNNDYNQEKQVLEIILTGNYAGVIIEPTKSSSASPNLHLYLSLEREMIPYLMINAFYHELEPTTIVLDDEKGGFIQAEHLIKLGHRDIVAIFKTDDMQGSKRLKGFIKAHRMYDIPINTSNIISYNTQNRYSKPVEKLEALLDSNMQTPTGIVCYNDQLVLELLDVLRKRDLQVPRDISIVGYDDSSLSEVSEVKLTTVKHPKSKMGYEAAQLLVEMIKNRNGSGKKSTESIVYEPELFIRTSTKRVGKFQEELLEGKFESPIGSK